MCVRIVCTDRDSSRAILAWTSWSACSAVPGSRSCSADLPGGRSLLAGAVPRAPLALVLRGAGYGSRPPVLPVHFDPGHSDRTAPWVGGWRRKAVSAPSGLATPSARSQGVARRRPRRRARPGRSPPAGRRRDQPGPPGPRERRHPGPARARRSPRAGRPGRCRSAAGGHPHLAAGPGFARRFPARTCSARPVSPSRTRACSRSARARVSPGQSGAARPGARPAARRPRNAASASGVAAARQLHPPADVADRHAPPRARLPARRVRSARRHPGRRLLGPPPARPAPSASVDVGDRRRQARRSSPAARASSIACRAALRRQRVRR